MDKTKNHEAFNYCYKLTKPGAVVPIDYITVDNLLIAFKEYEAARDNLYEIGGLVSACQDIIRLSEKAETKEQVSAILSVVSLKLSSIDNEINLLLSDEATI
jgi:hypothetical protein